MLDFPATAAALWAGYDSGALPRPEYVLPVLWTESGLNPATPNLAGAPYYGINQASGSYLAAQGIDTADYLTWPASQQIARVVAPMFGSNAKAFGMPHSGTLAYLSNFLPATLPSSRALSSVLATKGSPVYTANAGLDYRGKGTITTGDLAHFVAHAAAQASVKSATAQVYAARPGASPSDPVWGTDYLLRRALASPFALPAAGAVAAGVYFRAELAHLAGQAWRAVR